MEGFNIIPKEPTALSGSVSKVVAPPTKVGSELGSGVKPGVENKKSDLQLLSWAAYCIAVGVILYTAYLVFMRFYILNQISSVSSELQAIEQSVDKGSIETLKTVDQRLQMIKSRLSRHVLSGVVLDTINQYIRTTAQISEYKVETTDTELFVFLSEITPTFKDMAEQTEKLFDLKNTGIIKSFSITNLSYEQDTKRIRFTIKLVLDKTKYSAAGVLVQTQKN
jgi:uncharacterized protein Yka (UPF0111/DUF47 family)